MQLEAIYTDFYNSPIGILKIVATNTALLEVQFVEDKNEPTPNAITSATTKQLNAYFATTKKTFALPLQPIGTAFQQKVWKVLEQIAYGTTITYQKQAIQLGDVKAIRAMASANGKNPIAIIIPCHRVIGSDGSLTGYAAALWRKQWLLDHEAKINGTFNKLF
jgi:methylated-DNA-[protein]-cysteine S-methyltransferase